MKVQSFLFCILVTYLSSLILAFIFKVKVLIVTSNSMAPEFTTGDVLLTTQKDFYYLQDIVSFEVEKVIATHRISQIHTVATSDTQTKQYFQTKGDSNKAADSSFITPEQIIGKVNVVIPKVGYLVLFMKSKYMGLVGILFLILGLTRITYIRVQEYVYKRY